MTTDPQTDRFRRRTEIEARQWTGSNADAMSVFCSPFDFQTIDPEDRVEDPDQTAAVRTHPHGGWVGLKPGDWVVREAGRYTTASDEEFRADWEPAAAAVPVAVPPVAVDSSEDRCAECGHFRGAHEEAEEPVSVGRCTVCADEDEWHGFEAVEGTPVAAPPTTEQGDLRELVAAALYRHEWPGKQVWQQALAMDRETFLAQADAVLAALPAPADWAATLREAADAIKALDRRKIGIEADTIKDAWEEGRDEGADLLRRLADEATPVAAPRAAVSAALWTTAEEHIAAEAICCEPLTPGHRLCATGYAALDMVRSLLVDDPDGPAPLLDEVMRLVAGSPSRETTEPQPAKPGRCPHGCDTSTCPCLACEADTEPARPEPCAHCGKTILRISGTLAEWWVHDPSGHTVCFPEQTASSPRAAPAVSSRPGTEQEAEDPHTVCVCGHSRGEHVTVSGRLLCDECDPDSTDHLVCKEFEAL